ncbi:MAG: glycoside hydrolase family 2 protein [Marvinbryantia sp.]
MECSDNYFDLLPGEEKTIRIRNGKGRPFRICQIK